MMMYLPLITVSHKQLQPADDDDIDQGDHHDHVHCHDEGDFNGDEELSSSGTSIMKCKIIQPMLSIMTEMMTMTMMVTMMMLIMMMMMTMMMMMMTIGRWSAAAVMIYAV